MFAKRASNSQKRKWNQATVTRFSLEQFDLQFRLSLNVYMTREYRPEMVRLIKKNNGFAQQRTQRENVDEQQESLQ